MTVYADVIFFVNFAFDAEILLILLKIFSKKIPPVRFLLSTCLGGVQGIFVFIPYFRMLCTPPARFIMPFVIVSAVFMPCEKKELLRAYISFLMLSFGFSGGINFFKLKAIYGLLLPVPIYIGVVMMKRTIKKKRENVVLVYREKRITEEGFFDSGNMLKYNNTPVILAKAEVFEKMFGKGFSIESISEWIDIKDFCCIPYASLGKAGTVYGVKLDFVIVSGVRYDGAVLGYCTDNFSDKLILNSVMV